MSTERPEHEFAITDTQIAVVQDGRRVSGLHLGCRDFQLARGTYVSMGTIGGVSTSRTHRGKGLSSVVMAKTIEEMRERGLATSGLYTGTRIVAHRLYRRYGYVDVFIPHMRTLVLDVGAYLRRHVRRWLDRAEGTESGREKVAGLRGVVLFDLDEAGRYTLRLERGKPTLRKSGTRRPGLTVKLTLAALASIYQRTVSTEELLRSGDIELAGSRALWRRLQGTVFPAWETPIEQE